MSFVAGSTISYTLDGESVVFDESLTSHGSDELTLASIGGHDLLHPVSLTGALADFTATFVLDHGGVLTTPATGGGSSTGTGGTGAP